ncbi:MAG: single-stranded DNA-binding protein [Ilumatobacteraceae bacterium]
MDTSTVRSNLAVLRGTVTNGPTRRELASGVVVTQFDLATPLLGPERPGAVSVPVSWPDPPPSSLKWLDAGSALVVVGTVRRRFFRVNGATQSRTEVEAERVVPQRRAKSAQQAIDDAVRSLSP